MNSQVKKTQNSPECRVGVELRCATPDTWMWSPIWKLSEPHNLGLFLETSSQRHDRSLTQSPPPPPLSSWEDGEWDWKFYISCQGLVFSKRLQNPFWSFQVTKSHLIRIKDAPITQGNSRVLKTLHQEPGAKTKYLFLIMSQWLQKWLAQGDMVPSQVMAPLSRVCVYSV